MRGNKNPDDPHFLPLPLKPSATITHASHPPATTAGNPFRRRPPATTHQPPSPAAPRRRHSRETSMNFRFQNLVGAPYRGGNAVVSENSILISPVGNRISVTDLLKSETVTLPFESSSNISHLAISPDGHFLLSVDDLSRALFINIRRRVVLHRITFKSPVSALRFSPDGSFIAVAVGKLLQVWCSPAFRKEFFPFHLLCTFADFDGVVTSLDWSPDSNYLLAGSKDLTARIFSLEKSKVSKEKPFLFLGHRDSLVGVFFGMEKISGKVNKAYTISRDGAIFSWNAIPLDFDDDGNLEETSLVEFAPGTSEKDSRKDGHPVVHHLSNGKKRKSMGEFPLHKVKWVLSRKDFFNMSPAKLTACDYHSGLEMVVVAFSNGVFGLYQMPEFVCIHLLSVSSEKITTAVFNQLGNWLTFGCAKLGQLLVWEWRSESYILKQQGHYFDVNCLAYSPDSQMLATGADDNKVKVWTASSAFCFVTFSEHSNAITALHFTASKHCLLSASLDGTVRAWDLVRYRNFRIFTTPSSRQFVSLSSDQSGEIVCAGTLDSFEIFVWSMKTGRLLDIFSGHEGPVHGLMFSPTNAVLASSSWDKTVKLWDVFEGKGVMETFSHTHDVLTVVYRPDGKQLACSTLDGHIHFWDTIDGILMYTIEGRRDIAGGRHMSDRRSAANSSSGKCFTTLCYSADGSYILAGGSSKYICMYDIADQVLLRRFQITHNLALDGVLDILSSKKMTDAGPLDLIDDENSDIEEGLDLQTRRNSGHDLPGSVSNKGRPGVRTKCLQIAPTGRSWAAATTEGVLMYSIDDSFLFDPTDLDIDITPEAVSAALNQGQTQRALLLSLRLNEDEIIKRCVLSVKSLDIPAVASSVPFRYLQRLIEAFALLLENSPYLELILAWCQELCKAHGRPIQQNCRTFLPALKSLEKVINRMDQDLGEMCSFNEYSLQYLCSSGSTF